MQATGVGAASSACVTVPARLRVPLGLTACHPWPAQVNYELTLPAVRESLTFKPGQRRHLPIVTGFLGRGLQTGAITTLGRGGSDLTCTLLGGALGLPEVQVRSSRCSLPPLLLNHQRRCSLPSLPPPPHTHTHTHTHTHHHLPLCPVPPRRCGRMWMAC